MKIESSHLQLAASHLAQEHTSVQVSVNKPAANASANVPNNNPNNFANTANIANTGLSTTSTSAIVHLSSQSVSAAQILQIDGAAASPIPSEDEQLESDPRYELVRSLFEQITGIKTESAHFQLQIKANGPVAAPTDANQPGPEPAQAAPAAPAAPALQQTRTEIHTETETTQFAAQGSVTTSDGRQIHFSVDLNLERSHTDQSSRQLVNGKPVDPLVLNLDGNSVQLRDATFSFDLNSDGQTEQVRFVSSGSAFLALDKDGDNVINNGNELFGTLSGNGFQDLAAYDNDHNLVIDENDPIFSALRLYNKDANGQDQLSGLAEKGVGAIFLSNSATPFALKDQQNQLQGQLRNTGVYLNENGSAGTVQQIDIVV